MGTVNLKTGLSAAVIGAVFGVIFVVLVQIITASMGTGLIQPIDGAFFAFIGHYLGFFFTQLPGLIVLIATIIIYVIATISVQGASGDEPTVTAVTRGLLIGIGSSMNGVLAYNIYGAWFGQTAGLVIAIVLFVLAILSAFPEVSQFGIYQAVIGWLCWLAPMSWLVIGVGLILLAVSLVLGLVGLAGIFILHIGGDSGADPSVAGKVADANWQTGTFFLIGGLASNVNYMPTAFDMGNVGFIHSRSTEDHTGHESGHNLSLFVFGWVVHYIGAVDENFIGFRAQALTELLAESHTSRGRASLQMWA